MMSPDIGMLVQTAIAPIFLLVAVGGFLNVLTQRLSRVVDRTRALEHGLEGGETGEERARHLNELKWLSRRMKYAHIANTLCTVAALMICLVVALIFIGGVSGLPIRFAVAVLFILSMMSLVGGLGYFLAEVQTSTRVLQVRGEFLEKPAPKD